MRHYIIDGNNLIGKIKKLKDLQKKEKQLSRIELVYLLNNFFAGNKIKASLHFDGFEKGELNFTKGKIIYSNNKTSDMKIREEIDKSKNPRLITLISSDLELVNYAKLNSCSIKKADDFAREIYNQKSKNEENEKIKEMEKERDYFINLFK